MVPHEMAMHLAGMQNASGDWMFHRWGLFHRPRTTTH